MIPSFFKTRKAKQFNFRPRYYNEAQEELQERYNRIAAENKIISKEETTSDFQQNLRKSWERNKKTPSPQKQSNLRVIIIAAVLFLICFYFLF